MNADVYIVKNLNHPIIYGYNFLKQLNINISKKGLQITGKHKLKGVRVNYTNAFPQETSMIKIKRVSYVTPRFHTMLQLKNQNNPTVEKNDFDS